MGIRAIRLPADLDILADVTPLVFQYPENPQWSVQSDEVESMINTTRSLKRLWPLISLGMMISQPLRDILLGVFWEEDDRVVGTSLVQRRGTTDKWIIANVGVLPEYRRRGIARKLMEASLQLIRQRGGKAALLDVIEGNTPAISMYERLGFEHYGGSIEFDLTPGKAPTSPNVPGGYRITPMGQFEWQPRYELDKRISPATLEKFEPVEIGRYRAPAVFRLLLPIINAAQRLDDQEFGVFRDPQGDLVGRGGFTVQRADKGMNTMHLRVDPVHPSVASFLVQRLLHQVASQSPGKRIECSIPLWQKAAVDALDAAGFQRRMTYRRMGLTI